MKIRKNRRGEFAIKTFFKPTKMFKCFIGARIDRKTNGINKYSRDRPNHIWKFII